MNYYLILDKSGRPLWKEKTNYVLNAILLTEQQFENLEVEKEQRIFDLKQKLLETDYIACKIAEGAATVEEYYDIIQTRKEWRAEINELEGEFVHESVRYSYR